MKQLLLPANAAFSASGKTITFASTIPASVSHVLHVTNVTRGVLYFQPQGGSAYTGTYASPVLTLACSTTGHADTDKLEIFYDDGISQAAETGGNLAAIAGKDFATQATLSAMSAKLPTSLGIKTSANSLSIAIASDATLPVTGTFFQGTQPISAASLPLPTGAATSAIQTTQQSSLTSIDSKAPALGQALAAASVPVVLTAAQITTLTPLNTVAVTGALTDTQLRASALPVSATALPLPTGAATSAKQDTLSAQFPTTLGIKTSANSLSIAPASDGNFPVTITALSYPSSTGNNTTAQLAAGATFTGAIETVLSLQAAQVEVICDQAYTVIIEQFIDAGGTQKSSKDADYTFTRLAGVPTNENITLPGNYFRLKLTNNGGSTTTTLKIDTTFGIMATAPYSLTNLGNFKTSINEIGGAALTIGQKVLASSIPVAIASDQALPLPTGAATAANQVSGGPQTGSGVVSATTQRVTLATDGPEVTNSTAIKNSVAAIPAKGAATTANSTPVNIASDQTVPVSAASLPLPTGAATAANQVSGGPQTGIGIATATTQRVTLASDGPEVTNSTAVKNSTATIAATASAANPPSPDTTLALLVRNLQEDNALTQMLLADIAQLLLKVFTQTSGGANPSLSVSQATAGNLNVTANIAGTPASNISQVGAASVAATSYLPFSAINVPVMVSQQVPLPVVPTYIYAGITV